MIPYFSLLRNIGNKRKKMRFDASGIRQNSHDGHQDARDAGSGKVCGLSKIWSSEKKHGPSVTLDTRTVFYLVQDVVRPVQAVCQRPKAALRTNVILWPDMTYTRKLRANIGGRSSPTVPSRGIVRSRNPRIAAGIRGSTERNCRFFRVKHFGSMFFPVEMAILEMSDS
jgi:hypothetical protein